MIPTGMVLPDTRARLVYRIPTTGVGVGLLSLLGGDPIAGAVDDINSLWQANSLAVLTAPMLYPEPGGGLIGTDYYGALDIKTAHGISGPVAWSDYLAPYREPSPGLFGASLPWTLESVQILTAGTAASSPVTAQGTAQQAAQQSKASSPGLATVLDTASKRFALIVALVVVVLLLWRFGPAIARGLASSQ